MAIEIIFSILMFFGIFLTALPTIPGILYMLIVAILYGITTNFTTLNASSFAIFGILFTLAVISDYLSGLIGAKLGGANKKSILFGFVGLILGLFFFPPFGLFAGLFLGIFISEILQFSDHQKAFKAAGYSFAGIVGGMIINIALATIFFITFLILVF